jgi:hypothetical protein
MRISSTALTDASAIMRGAALSSRGTSRCAGPRVELDHLP